MSVRPVPPYLAASASAKDRCLPCQHVYFPCRLASIKSRPCCLSPPICAFVCLPLCVCVCVCMCVCKESSDPPCAGVWVFV